MSKISEINSKTSTEYIDEVYNYKGQWDSPSKCGLMIKKNNDTHIVIASELYDDNPGTSVNYWNCQIATMICRERSLDPSKLIFIEHTPDRGSKLENYRETFDKVIFQWDGEKFFDPDWEELSREQVDALLQEVK